MLYRSLQARPNRTKHHAGGSGCRTKHHAGGGQGATTRSQRTDRRHSSCTALLGRRHTARLRLRPAHARTGRWTRGRRAATWHRLAGIAATAHSEPSRATAPVHAHNAAHVPPPRNPPGPARSRRHSRRRASLRRALATTAATARATHALPAAGCRPQRRTAGPADHCATAPALEEPPRRRELRDLVPRHWWLRQVRSCVHPAAAL